MLSPERLLTGHRAKIIATAIAGAEILGGQGAIAQNPTPQPETNSASIEQTQIIGEVPFNLYAASWLMFPKACVIPPGAEPTPNVIPAAKTTSQALGIENPAPSIVLAKQTLSDGSTMICSLPNKPEPKPKTVQDLVKEKPKKVKINAVQAAVDTLTTKYADKLIPGYAEYPEVTPKTDLDQCVNGTPGDNERQRLADREAYCSFLVLRTEHLFNSVGDPAIYDILRTEFNYVMSIKDLPKQFKDNLKSDLLAN